MKWLTCLLFDHKWKCLDYFFGVEHNNSFDIIKCERCEKIEIFY